MTDTKTVSVFKFYTGQSGREPVRASMDAKEAEALCTGHGSQGCDERGEWFRAWVEDAEPRPEAAAADAASRSTTKSKKKKANRA